MTQPLRASAEADGPRSDVTRVVSPTSMSRRFWELDWSAELPWTIGDLTVESASLEDAIPFMRDHYPEIFAVDGERFLVEEMTPAKARFWAEMDMFALRSAGRIVGLSAGHPTDWSTYYVRTFSLLPEYRERGVAGEFFARLGRTLKNAGVARWEADVSPANPAIMRTFLRLGGIVTATVSSERWGQMLRMTMFMNEDAETAFHRQFIQVPAFGRRPRAK
jgi:hypothetical protein